MQPTAFLGSSSTQGLDTRSWPAPGSECHTFQWQDAGKRMNPVHGLVSANESNDLLR